VSKARLLFKYWLPVVIWMAVIFSASADAKSVQRSRFIAPILHWLFPRISEETISLIVLIARKCAHLTVYAIMGLLFWRALRQPVKSDPRPWSWPQAGWAVLFVALYAASDEFHQSFVPSRDASVRDVVIDTIGAMLGMLFLWVIGNWRKWWPIRAPGEVVPQEGRTTKPTK
jgi:VanZ family protein